MPAAPGFGYGGGLARSDFSRRSDMARYVDAFVIPLPKKNLEAYRRMAAKNSRVWLDHGALEYVECIADDVKPGKITSFPQSVKLKAGETVVFGWAVYKSRAHRDRVLRRRCPIRGSPS
jgi:uncharacterized protein YbaA (DUF1428 family)